MKITDTKSTKFWVRFKLEFSKIESSSIEHKEHVFLVNITKIAYW